jgi:hypothetical protein
MGIAENRADPTLSRLYVRDIYVKLEGWIGLYQRGFALKTIQHNRVERTLE